VLQDLLQMTREIEQALGASDPERLPSLLARRGAIFARLNVEVIPPEAEALLREIRASEERCLAMAAKQKKELQVELLAVRGQCKLEKAYGKFNGE
jgi:hypothetical protein